MASCKRLIYKLSMNTSKNKPYNPLNCIIRAKRNIVTPQECNFYALICVYSLQKH